MSNQKTLSVIVPIYNSEKYLRKCLKSIKKQVVFGGMEVICVNDGSSDNSLNILKSVVANDDRFIIVTQTNQGRSAARNKGLELASGKYIAFVDSDDIVGSSKCTTGKEFQEMVEHMEKDKIDLVVGGINVVHETNHNKALLDKNYYAPSFVGEFEINTDSVLRVNCSSCAKLFRKQIIDKYCLRYPVGLNYEDAFWWFCYAGCIRRAYYVNDFVYTYFRHDSGIMNRTFNTKDTALAVQHVLIIEKVFQFLKNLERVEENRKLIIKLFQIYINLAIEHCKDEDRLYVFWKSGKILRENDIDVSQSDYLSALKEGKLENFNFDPLLLRDARRWQRLAKILNQLFPQKSLRRRVGELFFSLVLSTMKKITRGG